MPKKIVIIIVVVVKYLAFIFGYHFAYSSIKIGFQKKKKILHYFQHFQFQLQYFQLQLQYFQPKNNQLAFRLFCHNTFSNKFSVSVKISGFQIDTKYVTLIYQENNRQIRGKIVAFKGILMFQIYQTQKKKVSKFRQNCTMISREFSYYFIIKILKLYLDKKQKSCFCFWGLFYSGKYRIFTNQKKVKGKLTNLYQLQC